MKGVEQAIVEHYRNAGLRVARRFMFKFRHIEAENFYNEHRGRFYFEGLVLAMTSGQCVAVFLEGENAIELVRRLNGATDPAKAEPGTIRHDFRSAGGPFNTVHASDSMEAYHKEALIVTKYEP